MPELPEVETIRRDLDLQFHGRRIRRAEATGSRSIRRHGSAEEFTSRLEGRTITAIDRRGKYLVLRLDGGEALVIHLGMSGQLLVANGDQPKSKHTHVVLVFEQDPELRFVDPRTFGELFVTAPGELSEQVGELSHLGFDPVVDAVSLNRFSDLVLARKTKLKPLLMDQRFIAGIGNMYADEILFRSRLRHDRSAGTLTPQEIRRLHRSIVQTLEAAIEHRGSSLADEQYRDLFGKIGDYQTLHNVYGREGLPCRRCRSLIVRVKAAGRSTFSCPRCQP